MIFCVVKTKSFVHANRLRIDERVIVIMIVAIERNKRLIPIRENSDDRKKHRDRKCSSSAQYTTPYERFSVYTSFVSVALTLVESYGDPPVSFVRGREPVTYEQRTTRATTSNKGSSPSPEVRLGVSGVSIYLVVGRPIGDFTGNRDD